MTSSRPLDDDHVIVCLDLCDIVIGLLIVRKFYFIPIFVIFPVMQVCDAACHLQITGRPGLC